MRKNALKSALAQKLRDGKLVCLENFDLPTHKTKDLEAMVSAGLGVMGRALLLEEEANRSLELAAGNNPRLKVETDNTAVGVLAFGPGGLSSTADSLSLFVNDSTQPVIRVGPWPVRPDAERASGPAGSSGGSP